MLSISGYWNDAAVETEKSTFWSLQIPTNLDILASRAMDDIAMVRKFREAEQSTDKSVVGSHVE